MFFERIIKGEKKTNSSKNKLHQRVLNFFASEKEQNSDRIILQNCELIPGTFFTFYSNIIRQNKISKGLLKKIVSMNKLWYLQKNFTLADFEFISKEKKSNKQHLLFRGVEPLTKNMCLLPSDNKKSSLKNIMKILNFRTGKYFKEKENFLLKFQKLADVVGVKMTVKKLEMQNNLNFVDLFLNFDEKPKYSLKPAINFDGSEFNSSLLIKNRDLFEKGIEYTAKLELIKRMTKKRSFLFSFKSEILDKKTSQRRFFLNMIKGETRMNMYNIGVSSKTKYVESCHKIKGLFKKKTSISIVPDKFYLSTRYLINLLENDKILVKTISKLSLGNYLQKNTNASLRVQNFCNFIRPKHKSDKFVASNENYIGNIYNDNDYFPSDSFGKILKKHNKNTKVGGDNLCRRSSFEVKKHLETQNSDIFIYFHSFSSIFGIKATKNSFFGIGLTLRNFVTFRFWIDRSGTRGFYIGM